MAGMQNMEGLATRFGVSLSLSEKEKGGIKIDKKVVEGALLGFHSSIVAEVFLKKSINESGFINQFINLWRRQEGVSIRALGGARFMAQFVRNMCRVLEVEKPWLFRDNLVLVVDGVQHGRWEEPLHLATMWVQLHNIPPLNMTEAVARAIGGLIGVVVKVNKDDGRDCIERFLRVRISIDVCEPLMWGGANVEFPNDGTIWVDLHYEGLPNYCLICGKVGHVTRWYKAERIRGEASEIDNEALYAFKGLDAEYDLRENGIMGRGDGQRGTMGRNGLSVPPLGRSADSITKEEVSQRYVMGKEEKERQWLERERAKEDRIVEPSRRD